MFGKPKPLNLLGSFFDEFGPYINLSGTLSSRKQLSLEAMSATCIPAMTANMESIQKDIPSMTTNMEALLKDKQGNMP